MKFLMTWCKKCQNTTEHEEVRKGGDKVLRCKVCKHARHVYEDGQVRDPFGPRGRGF